MTELVSKLCECRLATAAPAKLNLSLQVGGVRSDGYHDVWSVMCAVGMCDEVALRFVAAPGVVCRCDLPLPEENTATRATRAFLEHVGLEGQIGVEIELFKHIPSQAGMGGASADAAGVLALLAHAYKDAGERISDGDLYRIAASVGSDVPFCLLCLHGGCAQGTQRGEVVAPIECGLWGDPVLIFKLRESASTPAMYRALDERRKAAPDPIAEANRHLAVMDAVRGRDYAALRAHSINSFEAVVFERIPRLGWLKKALYDHSAAFAAMTGSGTAMFGIFESVYALDAAKRMVEREDPEFVWSGKLEESVCTG